MKIGIYGGSFSPPHNGHIGAAKAFAKEMALDRLLIMPSGISPHKTASHPVDPGHRLAMARLAFQAIPEVTVSDWEIRQEGLSYTAKTLAHFSSYGELYFLCGTDMFLTLAKWYHPEIIFEKAAIVLARREKEDGEAIERAAAYYRKAFSARLYFLKNPVLPLSSTEVRTAIEEGKRLTDYLPLSVEEYIYAHKLYSKTGGSPS